MNYKLNDTITIKLTSGEEVIGRFEPSDEGTVRLKKPVTFMMGAQGLGLVPFAFSAPQDITIEFPATVVICHFPTDKMVAGQYFKQTTGLTIQ
jgi:hypothetical protein